METTNPRLVCVVATPVLREAAAAEGILESHQIRVFVDPPGGPGATRTGAPIRVLVLAEDRRDAEKALAAGTAAEWKFEAEGTEGTAQVPPEARAKPTPDDYADRAYRAAILWFFAEPLLVVVPYYFFRALWASKRQPVVNGARFEKRMVVAAVLGILLPWGLILWVLSECV